MRFNYIRKPGPVAYLLAGVLALGSLFMTRPVSAAEFDSGLFVGVGYGAARERSDIDVEKSKNNGLYKLFAGYQFRDYLGAEVGYANFDNLQRNLSATQPGVTQHMEIKSYYARVYGQLPIMRQPKEMLALYVAGGAHRWDITEEFKLNTITYAAGRDHDISTMFGAGLSYRARDAQFRIEFELFKDIGDVNEIDIRAIQFNLMFFL